MKADRYLLPLVPAGAVGAAALLEAGAAAVSRGGARRGAAFAAAGVVALAGPLAARLPAHWATLRTDTRAQARQWIERHLPAGSMVATEAYGPELFSPLDLQGLDPEMSDALRSGGYFRRLYALQYVPMFQVEPERSAKYYALSHWGVADALVITDAVRGRYAAEPKRYGAQLAFYDSLEARWPKVASFEPRGGPGPAIAIHRNPAATLPFAARRPATPPDTAFAAHGPAAGSEGFFYYNLGVNHEVFVQVPEARRAYLLALRYGGAEPEVYADAGARLLGSLWSEGRRRAALALADELVRRAPGRRQAEQLAGLKSALLSGEIEAVAPVPRR
jgi:hypothetical protein